MIELPPLSEGTVQAKENPALFLVPGTSVIKATLDGYPAALRLKLVPLRPFLSAAFVRLIQNS